MWDGATYEEFTSAEQVAQRLAPEKAVVYAHNGGRFDYYYLRDWINESGPVDGKNKHDGDVMLIGGRLAKFKIGLCEFRDSMNLFPFALDKYKKEKIDYALFESDVRHLHMKEISAYLKSDCVNLWELVTTFFNDYGRSLTQAGASMRIWSKMEGCPPPRQTPMQYEKFQPYYFGGRVQCFERGVKDCRFSVMDINSAYPFAMTSNHPFSTDAELLKRLPKAGEWNRSFIRLDAISYGALPFLDDANGVRKLEFPHDDKIREYCVTGWELEAALETDSVKIIKVKDVWRFPLVKCFTSYVERFYTLKSDAQKAGDGARYWFAKYFLNGLYGKFGANPANYREYRLVTGGDLHGYLSQNWSENAQWGARTLIEKALAEEKQRFYNIATAASITGFVRAFLWRALYKSTGRIYCDTDSLASQDCTQLVSGSELGQWKTELDCDRFAVAGKKLYAFRSIDGTWKTASKGAILTPQQIESIASGETVTYQPMVPTYSAHRDAPRFINREIRRT